MKEEEEKMAEELVEACKEALSSYGRNGDLSAVALEKMEDAIAKATGASK